MLSTRTHLVARQLLAKSQRVLHSLMNKHHLRGAC